MTAIAADQDLPTVTEPYLVVDDFLPLDAAQAMRADIDRHFSNPGLQGLAQSATPAASLLEAAFGPVSRTLVSAFIALSALKSVNATVFFGARTYFALGRDLAGLRWLGDWEGDGGPRRALLVQAVITLWLIAL